MPPRYLVGNFETTLAGGVHLYDVTGELPTSKNGNGWPERRAEVERIYLHHSGRLGAGGFAGLYNSARYTVRSRGWEGTPYHYWIPFAERRDDQGALVVFRANPDAARSFHTGGEANSHGLSVALQGNLSKVEPSDYQVECLEALIPWLQVEHLATLSEDRWLSFHAESAAWGGSGKPTCPGPHVEAWVRKWRGDAS